MSQAALSKPKIPSSAERISEGQTPTVLADIYRADCHIALWRRELETEVQHSITAFVSTHNDFQSAITLSPEKACDNIQHTLGDAQTTQALSQDIAELLEMFCCLFDLQRAALRLAVLSKAMCPRFHVDHVPCRLLTTYQGAATEWLPHSAVDRSKLGHRSAGLSDTQSGLFQTPSDIQRLRCGDVALLKGERWAGNEGAGAVHRSPAPSPEQPRLFLSLDFA